MLSENVYPRCESHPTYIHLKTEYVLELGNEICPLTLSRGLFSYAGRTFGAEYGCDPHSMFMLNADLDDKRGNVKIEHMAVKYLRKDRCFLILFLNEKFLEKLSPKQYFWNNFEIIANQNYLLRKRVMCKSFKSNETFADKLQVQRN